jgi:hypothetical protein
MVITAIVPWLTVINPEKKRDAIKTPKMVNCIIKAIIKYE